MKKVLLLLIVNLFIGVEMVQSQTYFYKCVYDVDENTGARSSPSFRDTYITFNNQGCYISDKNGNMTISTFYKFRGRKNNVLVYQAYEEVQQITMYGFVKTGEIRWLEENFTFSSNRERANWKIPFYKYIRVFERANPEDIDVPDQLY